LLIGVFLFAVFQGRKEGGGHAVTLTQYSGKGETMGILKGKKGPGTMGCCLAGEKGFHRSVLCRARKKGGRGGGKGEKFPKEEPARTRLPTHWSCCTRHKKKKAPALYD